jgi:dihydroorotate dehydrogenase (NAD+) catalytic subunit
MIGRLALPNPVICGSGEPVMTESGIRAALRAGVAGVIAKSVNEQPDAARQLDRADYAQLDAAGAPVEHGVSIFCRSGLAQREPTEWFAAIARIDRDAAGEGRFVAASVVLSGADGAEELARTARHAGLRVFELNVGAPHASEATPGAIAQETDPARLGELVARVRAATEGMQLWVKLTGLSANLPALAVAASQAGADAVCMMGRFMAMVPDLATRAPDSAPLRRMVGRGPCRSSVAFWRSAGAQSGPHSRCSAPMARDQVEMSRAWRSPVHRHASCCQW